MKNWFAMGAVFLLGAVAGITVALLQTPYSGEKTREKLRDGFIETRSRTHEAISDVQARAKGTVESLQQLAHEIGDSVKPTPKKLKVAVGR